MCERLTGIQLTYVEIPNRFANFPPNPLPPLPGSSRPAGREKGQQAARRGACQAPAADAGLMAPSEALTPPPPGPHFPVRPFLKQPRDRRAFPPSLRPRAVQKMGC